jgi:uncharacterized protein
MRLKFVPREKVFFTQFQRGAENVVDGARRLLKMISDWDDPPLAHREIVELEHRGDEITHEIMRTLNTTFITPIDREDIHALASGIDDVMDFIEATAEMFILHRIEKPNEAVREQADVLVRACEGVAEAVKHLQSFKNLEQYWIEVNRIENEGDKRYRRAVADLFGGNYKAMEVLKWKEIYDLIEAAIDGCENIVNTLEAIVLKNA